MLGRSKPAMIRPVLGNAELGQDVGAGARVGGRGQREPRHVRMVVEQRPQLAIVGPEIVAPFADAMRFVDRDQREFGPCSSKPPEAVARRALGRDVEQVELAGLEPLDRSARGRRRPRSATRP